MIATENNAIPAEAEAISNLEDTIAELGRRHTGVPTSVIDLVRGRLKQKKAAVLRSLKHCRLNHPWMR
jgi:hypothetical protein